VSLDDGAEFPGRDALAHAKGAGVARKLSCLRATGRGIMRAGYVALHQGQRVTTVTSGGFSPMLNESIGMAYLPLDLTSPGTELEIDVRGKMLGAVVVKRPFYRRAQQSS
jgi:aminomethyltransferase